MLVQQSLVLSCLIAFAVTDGAIGENELDHDAPIGAYSYHVSIRQGNKHICSGSIINQQHVLTSKYCVTRDNSGNIIIVAGTRSLSTSGVSYGVRDILPYYEDDYDFAILRTANDIIFNNNVQSIPIATKNDGLYNFERLTLTGWERPITGQYGNDKLQQIFYQFYDHQMCWRVITYLKHEHICSIQPSSQNACNIDLGAPVVSNGIQVAMKSYRVSCENNNEPHLYLSVSRRSSWIERNSRI